MNKIFTLFALAAATLTASAATPELLFEGQPVQAGKTYETGWTVESFDMGALVINNYTQDSELTLRGTVGAGITLEVEGTQSIQVCGIDGQCVKGTNITKTGILGEIGGDVISTEGNQVTVKLQIENLKQDMSGKPAAEVLPNITVNVTAYYTATPEQKATTTVILTNKSADEIGGIGAVESSDYVRLSSRRVLSYNVAAPTKLNIYGVTGQLVVSQMIYSNGSVSLDAIPAGMYIYRAGNHTGKILVK